MRIVLAILVALIAGSPVGAQTASGLGVVAPGGVDSTTQAPARDNVASKAGTAVIRGRVLAADTGRPLVRADVTLSGSIDVGRPSVATDEQGRYEFRNVPAGSMSLRASKAGFVPLAYGQRRAVEASRPVAVADGQVLENMDFALPRGGVIVARVLDERGEAMAGVTVNLFRMGFEQGQRRLVGVNLDYRLGVMDSSARDFRLSGLPPGDYYVSAWATPRTGPIAAAGGRRYVTTYYPGTANERDAQRVSLALGQEVAVTIRMLPMKLARVTGTIRTAGGAALSRPDAFLQAADGNSGMSVETWPDGTFAANNVLPGDYELMVQPTAAGDVPEVAWMPITVADRDVTGVSIVTTNGATVRGRFVFDTGTTPTDLRPGTALAGQTAAQVSVQFWAPGSGVAAYRSRTFNPDWTFELRGIVGTGGLIRPPAASGFGAVGSRWYVKAILLNGRDVIDTPLSFDTGQDLNDVQIVLTQKRAELTGGATDDKGEKSTDFFAVIFPEDRAQWTPQSRFFGTGRSDQTGQFKIGGLPPGKYLAAAIDYLQTGEERDPDLLKRLTDAAVPITLGDGEAKSVTLKVAIY